MDYEIGRFSFAGWTDWDFIGKSLNWISFTFVELSFEDDKMFGNYEIVVGLLGFNAKFAWHYADTEYMALLERQMKDLDP
jgi:hypothetical protein